MIKMNRSKMLVELKDEEDSLILIEKIKHKALQIN